MNVKELKALIANLPDDASVYVWVSYPEAPRDRECQSVESGHISGPTQEDSVHLDVIVR